MRSPHDGIVRHHDGPDPGRHELQRAGATLVRCARRLTRAAGEAPLTVLTVVAEVAAEEFPDVLAAGAVGLDPDGGAPIVAGSTALGRRLQEREAALGEGPATDVLAHPVIGLVADDLGEDPWPDRWPRWCAEADRAGVVSLHAVPLADAGSTAAVLVLFGAAPPAPGTASEGARWLLRVFAGQAELALAASLRQHTVAVRARDAELVGRATGVLAERHGYAPRQAAAELEAWARRAGRPLPEVAAWLTDPLLDP